jgi:hypothetical protein
MSARAREPFRFFTRQALTVATGVKAADLKELLEGISGAPDAVIYFHTHRFLQTHQFLVPEPPNDFAYWVTEVAQDPALGERLAAVDTVSYASLRALREAFVSILKNAAASRRVPEGKEFHFLGAVRFSLPTPHEASTLEEFAAALRKVTISSLYLHVFEARLRPPRLANDFSLWLESQLGEKSLAEAIARLDPYNSTLEGLRARVLELIDKRLQESVHAAS